MQDGEKQHAREELDQAIADKQVSKMVVWCGSGVGLIKSIEHAEALINKLVKDTKLIFTENTQLTRSRVLGQSS